MFGLTMSLGQRLTAGEQRTRVGQVLSGPPEPIMGDRVRTGSLGKALSRRPSAPD